MEQTISVDRELHQFMGLIGANRPDIDLADVMVAAEFAASAHHGEVRRYTGDPYVVHPLDVALQVALAGLDATSIKGALNHDVLENTTKSFDDLASGIGMHAALLVDELTDSKSSGTRAVRVQRSTSRLAVISSRGKSIKLADIISNVRSILQHDRHFARTYVPEKRQQIEVLKGGHPGLFLQAHRVLELGHIDLFAAKAA